jgi:3-hydroxybutyryl-CoA dehydratase
MLKLGDSVAARRAFSREDVAAYVRLAGAGSATSPVPEPLIGALFSRLLGMELPGLGTNYLKQETEYVTSADVDEPLWARVEVTRLRPDKQLVDLATTCHGADERLIATGRALVYAGDVEHAFESL